MTSALNVVETLKEEHQDFEWYPTTPGMLNIIKKDVEARDDHKAPSVLDCGAGDGRALIYLTKGDRYAIEKSYPLIDRMDASISIVGTEFNEQTLIDKKVDVVFCNPPYSEFTSWVTKIIREANAPYLYFIVPTRWKDCEKIKGAIALRDAKPYILGTLNFHDAERKARATVDIVKIQLSYSGHSRQLKENPFDVWFDASFNLDINNTKRSKYDWKRTTKKKLSDSAQHSLVVGGDAIKALASLYQSDLNDLMRNYKSIENIDPVLLDELNVNIESLKSALQQKIEGLKDIYWRELFDRLNAITRRLTVSSRQTMLDRLHQHIHVDFSAKNAYAILTWVIKNANTYYDTQLIKLVESMTERANIALYKSNHRVYRDNEWHWRNAPDDLARYALERRIVSHRMGGIDCCPSDCRYERTKGLAENAKNYINDIITVAHNLGFERPEGEHALKCNWTTNTAVCFYYKDHKSGHQYELMKVRAFYNGNLHIQFNQAFMGRLNVEFGRLKGWIQSPTEATQEMDINMRDAATAFRSNLKMAASKIQSLTFTPCERPALPNNNEDRDSPGGSQRKRKPQQKKVVNIDESSKLEKYALSTEQQNDLFSLIDAAL